MKSVETKLTESVRKDILDKLHDQIGAVECFLNESMEKDKYTEEDLGNRYEIVVGDKASSISVKDRGLNAELFTINNRFVRSRHEVKVISTITFGLLEQTRYTKTVSALNAVNWIESHSN